MVFLSVVSADPALQWRILYIGSSDNDQFDQLLEEFDVPISEASEFQFQIQAPPPVLTKLPCIEDVFDVTAVMIVVNYDDREFFRCSFLVSHQYGDQQPRECFTEQGLFR